MGVGDLWCEPAVSQMSVGHLYHSHVEHACWNVDPPRPTKSKSLWETCETTFLTRNLRDCYKQQSLGATAIK